MAAPASRLIPADRGPRKRLRIMPSRCHADDPGANRSSARTRFDIPPSGVVAAGEMLVMSEEQAPVAVGLTPAAYLTTSAGVVRRCCQGERIASACNLGGVDG